MKNWLFYLLLVVATAVLAKPTVTVYTSNSFSSEWGPGPAIKKAFEHECDCELKFIPLGDGMAVLNRLRLEGKNSQADIVLGLDNNLLQAAHDTGLFAPHKVDTKALTLPSGWHDNTFLPYDYSNFAFVYDRTKLKIPPRSFHELVNSSAKLTIIYEDPRTSTSGLGLLLWVQKIYGANAPAAWGKLAGKTVTVTKGWSEAYCLFLKGEADMVFSYTTSPAYHIIEEKTNHYAAATFSEGHYQHIEVAGQLTVSKQPSLAQLFMQFILTPVFQQIMFTGNWMYPVTNMPLPDGFEVPSHQILSFTPQQVAANRDVWVKSWQQAVSR